MSAMRAQPAAAPWALRRIHLLQRVSGVQVGQAELHWRKVPGVQNRRPRGEEGASWEFLLRLLQLSQVPVHVGLSPDRRSVSGVRQYIFAGEEPEIWNVYCVSE